MANRRDFLKSAAFTTLAAGVGMPGAATASRTSLTGLKADAWPLLPLGSIKATGWLKAQLLLQANGLGDIMWNTQPDMGGSAWLEGEYDAGHPPANRSADLIHPRGPIYFEGAAHLAAALDDTDEERVRYQQRAEAFVRSALKSAKNDGYFGPEKGHDQYYWWPWAPIMRGLSRWYTYEPSEKVRADILRTIQNYCMYMTERLDRPDGHLNPSGSPGKQGVKVDHPALLDAIRWLDILYFVQWTYDNTKEGTTAGDGQDLRTQLLSLMVKLRDQGLDWMAVYDANGPIESIDGGMVVMTEPVIRANYQGHVGKPEQHGVNVSQALKIAPLLSRWKAGNADYDGVNYTTFLKHWKILQQNHGQPTGMFSCDEHLSGTGPHHGNELCSTAETLLSLETALSTFGEAELADYIEKIAFNALPSQTNDDVSKHQYVGQTNQIYAGILDVGSKNLLPYASDNESVNKYDIVQGINCCSASVQHAWPRLTSCLWLSAGTGLVSAIIAPSHVTAEVGPDDHRQTVSIQTVTDYPFRGTVAYTVTSLMVPTTFPLIVRSPAWARGEKKGGVSGAVYRIIPSGGRSAPYEVHVPAGKFADVRKSPNWEWRAGDRIEVTFPTTVNTVSFHSKGDTPWAYVQSGPLLFAHNLTFEPRPHKFKQRTFFELIRKDPDSFKLQINPTGCRRVDTGLDGTRPFSWANPPVRIKVKARAIMWQPTGAGLRDYAKLPTAIEPSGRWTDVELVPFGCTALRMAGLPVLT